MPVASQYEQAVRVYFNLLERGDYAGLLNLFSKYAVVDFPLYGKMQASEFLNDLKKDSTKSKTTILNIYESAKFGAVAAHFSCQWIMRNAQFTNYEGVGLFQISPEGKIDKLSFIFDTAKLGESTKRVR
jgi:ketosteroid isomerase-like protein